MAHFESNSVPQDMENQFLDHITFKNLIPSTDLKSLVSGYILNCQCEGKSPRTISTYEELINRFIGYCQERNFPLEQHSINVYHLRDFIAYIGREPVRWGGNSTSSRKPASQATVNHYYRVLRTFFNWLKKEGFISLNPILNIKPPKISHNDKEALSQNEIKIVLQSCSPGNSIGCRNRAILMIFLDTGLRLSELAALELNDLNMDTGAIIVRQGKGNKQRIVRMGFETRKVVWRYINKYRGSKSNKLFLDRCNNPLKSNAIQLMVRKLAKKTNLTGLHVHKLRHTFAISYLRSGGDIFTLKYLLGHSSLSIVENYLKSLNVKDAAKAHERFSPMDNLNLKS